MPPPFAWGSRTFVMGVLNVTPDSFSDGGLYADPYNAVVQARQMIRDGAHLVDVGGESTRPATFGDHSPLPAEEEKRRVLPVISRISAEFPGFPISVDTYKADVARAALDAGASVINDISGLTFDPDMASVAAEYGCPAIVMHLLGEPRNIPLQPHYDDVINDVRAFWERQVEYALAKGMAASQIWLDPGLGFGKTTTHNLEILRRLPELKTLGFPLVVGSSRKKFLGKVLGIDNPSDRKEGTAATIALSIAGGADVVRVHDVREMARVAKVSDAVVRGWTEE